MVKKTTKKDSKQEVKKKDSFKTFEINQNITIDEIQEKFPALYEELTDKKMSIRIDEVENNSKPSPSQEEEKNAQDPFSNYDPDVFDFLARARTNEEGLEIIEFLTKQGQISAETAKDLTGKLKKLGVRSFGPIRSSDYYYRKSDEIRNRRLIQKRYYSQTEDKTND
ncbi:MAG: DUF2095 family protein [Candidatus Heimdallarchaeota archaeon]|nr:MAG: DUF2095 family protein [Candidatus Heimdallarchaeota archaeon]